LSADFAPGAKPLVPGVFVHGVAFSAEEYYTFPMMLASHGYFMVSPTMMDGSAPWTPGKDGNDIWMMDMEFYTKEEHKLADGTNPVIIKKMKEMLFDR